MVIEFNSKLIFLPCGGQAADHDVEGVVIGFGDVGEEEGGISEVFEVNDSGEEEVRFVDGVYEHLGVDLLQLFGGGTLFQEV